MNSTHQIGLDEPSNELFSRGLELECFCYQLTYNLEKLDYNQMEKVMHKIFMAHPGRSDAVKYGLIKTLDSIILEGKLEYHAGLLRWVIMKPPPKTRITIPTWSSMVRPDHKYANRQKRKLESSEPTAQCHELDPTVRKKPRRTSIALPPKKHPQF